MNAGFILLGILATLVRLYSYAILADALLSFVFRPGSNAFVRGLHFIVEPVVAPCRQLLNRLLPATVRLRMRLDFSPLLALFLVRGVEMLLYWLQAALYY